MTQLSPSSTYILIYHPNTIIPAHPFYVYFSSSSSSSFDLFPQMLILPFLPSYLYKLPLLNHILLWLGYQPMTPNRLADAVSKRLGVAAVVVWEKEEDIRQSIIKTAIQHG